MKAFLTRFKWVFRVQALALATILVLWQVPALGTTEDPVEAFLNLLPQKARPWAELGLKIVPPEYRTGFEDYLRVVGVNPARGANSAMVDYNEKLLKENGCFADLAGEFYHSIQVEDLQRSAARGTTFFYDRKNGFMSLAAKVQDFNKEPGWAWNRALTMAGGSKLLAMQIIGVCGHDDVQQMKNSDGFMVSDAMALKLRGLRPKAEVLHKVALAEKAAGSQSLEYYYDWLNGIFSLKNNRINCPEAASAFYAPKALSDAADIPEELRVEIAQIQAPTKGASSLAGKNYHIMGAAFADCFLLRQGIPYQAVGWISKGAMYAYRQTRICERLQWRTPPELDKFTLDEILSMMKQGTVYNSGIENLPPAAQLSQMIQGDLNYDWDMNEIQFRALAERVLAQGDAAAIFHSSPYFARANRCEGPQTEMAVHDFLWRNGNHAQAKLRTACPDAMPAARCARALEIIDTYWIDMRWTWSQHSKGVQFAIRNCPLIDPAMPPEKEACRVLNNQTAR